MEATGTIAGTTEGGLGLAGQTALVTGAAGDLGRGIASVLAAQGATVLCADVRSSEEVVASLPPGRGVSVELDVTDSAAVDRVMVAAAREHGGLDILVNNAGLAQSPAPLADTPDEVIERLLDVNVRGVLHCARAAAGVMTPRRSGRIVNIASQAGRCGVANWAVYCASKAAVIAATQAQALELAPHGITVNAICPGPMSSEMTRRAVRLEAEAAGLDWREVLEAQTQAVPLRRLGTPEELGEMVAWIASARASFTTGASFNLTGGASVFF